MEINIQEILRKNGIFESDLRSNGINAIKEIVELVLQEAADSAELIERDEYYEKLEADFINSLGGSKVYHGRNQWTEINRESITSVINKVKF